MRIALLGANGQIASDLVRGWAGRPGVSLALFSRRPADLALWLEREGLGGDLSSRGYDEFGPGPAFDALVNCVGVGDPARAAAMGSQILGITRKFDDLALRYLDAHPACRYVFFSSGAAYGSGFSAPATEETEARIPLNRIGQQDFYAMAKLYAEVAHRARPELAIVDLRVFNIFSRTQDLSARFFVTDLVRALREGTVLRTSPQEMTRDYQHPSDLQALVDAVLAAPPANTALDCYSRAAVGKQELLQAMQERFALRWEFDEALIPVNATGAKPCYHSTNHRAAAFGYRPRLSSLETLTTEIGAILSRDAQPAAIGRAATE